MAATTSMDRIETLIRSTAQRLTPLALQRLSVGEILGDTTTLASFIESLPSKAELHVTPEQEPVFYRMLKFLNVHEPTAWENDEAHKRNVVQYLALLSMLQECRSTKLVSLQQACVSRMLRWFDETFGPARVALSTSTPILPPRMSPKKTNSAVAGIARSTSDTGLREDSTEVVNDMVAKKLERYKTPNLRASHIRRIAALRSRGAEIDDELLGASENGPTRMLDPKPVDVERVAKQKQTEATFRSYRPETDAEREMNLLWLTRRQEEEIGRKKDIEIQQLVHRWTIDRSREESEFLRKRETTKLVVGLERAHRTEVSVINQKYPQSSAISSERKPETEMPLSKSCPSTQLKESILRSDESQQTSSVVVKIRKHSKPIASGGMHFRNQLPANYTPSSKGSSSSTSSGRGGSPFTSLSSVASSAGIRSMRGNEKIETLMPSSSSDSDGDASDSCNADDEEIHKRKRMYSADLEVNKGARSHAMQSYHIPYFSMARSQRVVLDTTSESIPSIDITAFNRMYPPGTIPPQPKPADPEFRHFYDAVTARQVAPTTAVMTENASLSRHSSTKTFKINASSSSSTDVRKVPRPSTTSKAEASREGPRVSQPSAILPIQRQTSNVSSGRSLGVFPAAAESVSDLRRAQLTELEKIRLLFEQNHLQFNDSAFERGLLVPEDRSAMDCALNLPIAGSRLVMNPLASTRLRAGLGKKKKRGIGKKKKKVKKGAKGLKSARSSSGKARK